MFQFGNGQQGQELYFYGSNLTDLNLYNQNAQNDHQRTLETLKVQTDYLVTEINGMKEIIGEFISQVRGRLDNLTENVSQIQRINQGVEKPKKKFKKGIYCPYDDCPRKYSSKIALNCHIRTKHKRNIDLD